MLAADPFALAATPRKFWHKLKSRYCWCARSPIRPKLLNIGLWAMQ